MVLLEKPDTGYAWVIAFAACIINMILSGISRMTGILYVAIIEAYGVSRQEASVPFTVRNSIRYLTGKCNFKWFYLWSVRRKPFLNRTMCLALCVKQDFLLSVNLNCTHFLTSTFNLWVLKPVSIIKMAIKCRRFFDFASLIGLGDFDKNSRPNTDR